MTTANIIKILSTGTMAVAAALSTTQYAWAQEELQHFPQVDTMSPLNVDLQSGTFVEQGTEFSFGPFVVDHYIKYTSPAGGQRPFKSYATSLHGRSWNIQTGGISGGGTNRQIIQIGSKQITFSILANGAFAPVDSSTTGWKMNSLNGKHILTYKDGTVYRFASHPALRDRDRLLIATENANGHIIKNSYDSTGRLKFVESNYGYVIIFDYMGDDVIVCGYNRAINNINASSNCNKSNIKTRYARDARGKLISITNPLGNKISFRYFQDKYLECVTLSNSSQCRIENTFYTTPPGSLTPGTSRFYHVVKQETADGEEWQYSHFAAENFGADNPGYVGQIVNTGGSYTDPNGSPTSAVFANGFLETVYSPAGRLEYEYSSLEVYFIQYLSHISGPHYYSVFPSKITYPEGNSISFTRDYGDNVTRRIETPKSGSDDQARMYTWIYPTAYKWSSPSICDGPDVLCDKPTQIIAPDNQITDMTYDPVHGGILTRTGPADGAGVRPQTRYSYVQRVARDANGDAVGSAIWKLESESFCKTTPANGNGCAGGTADEVVTYYEYGPTSGPNNLNLIGTAVTADGETLRSCYSYDVFGRKISETQPKANLASCPLAQVAVPPPPSFPPPPPPPLPPSGDECGGLPCQ